MLALTIRLSRTPLARAELNCPQLRLLVFGPGKSSFIFERPPSASSVASLLEVL